MVNRWLTTLSKGRCRVNLDLLLRGCKKREKTMLAFIIALITGVNIKPW